MKNLPKLLLILFVFFVILNLALLGIFLNKKDSEFSLVDALKKISPFRKKPGSCLVLEEKYCQTGKPVYKEDELTFIGFQVPEKTPIFSPFTGNFSNAPVFLVKKGEEHIDYPGILVERLENRFSVQAFAAAYYDFIPPEKGENFEVKQGEIIGQVSLQKIEAYGDYNLLVGFAQFDQEKKMHVTDKDLLKKLFSL